MSGHLLPSDADWPKDKRLMADLSHLNTGITHYIFALLDADASRAAPISVEDERAFSQRLVELGNRVQARADTRALQVSSNGRTIQGEPPTATSP